VKAASTLERRRSKAERTQSMHRVKIIFGIAIFFEDILAALLGGKIFLRELFDKALSVLAHADGADYFRIAEHTLDFRELQCQLLS